MSKEEKDTLIRYGQGILLKGFSQGSGDEGMLTAKGFADTAAKYQTYKDILYFKNYRNAIFQIVPASNFQINDELRKFQEKSGSDKNDSNLKILEARAKSEKEQFQLNCKTNEKRAVCFGDLVMFKHVDSENFLSGTIRPSQKGKNGSFVVEVTKNLSQILIFKVQPFRSYEKINMEIPFDSPIKLFNIVNNGYLTYEKVGLKDQKKNKTQEQMVQQLERKAITADDSYIIPVKTNSSQSQIYECVTHFDDLSKASSLDPKPMPWKFTLHMREVENQSLIQHDIIYFQHTEKNSILSTQGKEIILKQMKKQTSEELPFYQCLWEIEKQESFGKDAYILRHLMSGMTLGITKDNEGNPSKAELFDISEGAAEGNLGWVELKLAKKEKKDIESDSFINICSGEWCLDRQKDEQLIFNQEQESKQNQKEPSYISIPKLNKLAVNELEYEVKKVKFTTQISKNCFKIMEIDDGLKKQVLFALSFHSTIIKLRQALKWGHQISNNTIKYKELMQITDKIKEIKDFLKNCSKDESDLQHIKPIFKRQMICKDLGISQLLFELLFYMRKNLEGKYHKHKDQKNENSNKIQTDPYIFKGEDKVSQYEKFIELYNSIYDVCYELIRDNLLFKIYVSKWINFVILDLIRENQTSHLKLLKQIFRNNQFLVKNFVNQKLIEDLAKAMLSQKENYEFVQIKYLQLFRLFCIVGESVNTSSQIAILNKFVKYLKHDNISNLYQITLSKQNEDIFAEAAIDKNQLKKRVFKDYFKICKEEYSSAWAYFVQYLNLMADMTKGRNKLVEDYMRSMFTIEIMTDLFIKQEQLKEAQAPIIRIIHNLFIESNSYYPIEKRKRISEYEKLKAQQIEVMRYSKGGIQTPWQSGSILRILNGIVGKLKKFGPIQAEATPLKMLQNQNLYQILSFIWQTLNLGFWQTKEQVKDILTNITRILEPHQNIVVDYSKASIQNKHNSLMMKCKEQCMNIIQLILDYDLDLQVRYICKFFQNFQVPTKKRQLIHDEKMLQSRIDDPLAIKFLQELPKKNMTLVQPTIIGNMIELSKYNNPKLTSSAISIMQRVLLKNKKAIQSFCQQIFVSSDERIALMKYIQDKKEKFYIMQDQTLVKIKKLEDQVDNYVALYKQDNIDSGIMQIIYTMSELVKNQASALDIRSIKSLQQSGMSKKLGQKRLINFTDERTSSNIMKQSVMDSENIHLKILQFVLNCSEVPEEESESLKLLHLSYKFLVSLIWNYQNIKATLINFIPYIQHHLKKNVGCIDFLKEMYDNNKTMLFNQINVSNLVKQICNSINNEPDTSFYKSKLLDFFRFLIYCNGKTLKNNQIQILKIMQDDSFKNIILAIDKTMIQTLVQRYKVEFQTFQTQKNQSSSIKIQPKLLYLITYFQILTSLIDDKNSVNMGKLKKRFPFDKLVDWIKSADTCWPLKRNIRAFLNRLYYFEPQIEIYMKKIIGEELDNIISDLNKYILIKCKSNIGQIQGYFFNDPVRFSYLQSYLYLNLQENLFTLYQLATDPKIQHQMKTILHPIDNKSNKGPIKFIRICQRLGFIKNYFAERKNVYTNSFIKFLLSRFEAVIKEFDDDIYAPGMNLPSDQPRAPMKSQKQVARKGLINKIMKGDIGTFYVQATGQYDDPDRPLVYRIPDKITNPKDDKKPNQNKLLKKLREILKREKKQFKNSDEEIDYKLNTLVTAIKLSQQATAYLTLQYNQNLKVYSQNDEIFGFVTIIIDMIAKNPKALPVKEKRFFLNFITGIVEQNNHTVLEKPKTIDQWQTEDWTASEKQISYVQNKLKSAKLGNLITQLLKQNIEDDIQFADSLLLCGISYLFGGNTNTQNNIIETIKGDKENKVMRNLEKLISKLGEFIVKNIEESSKKQINTSDVFSITTIDNWDFYDISKKYVYRKNVFEPQTTDQQIYSKICIRAYKRAFKFLQLLCQNNNIDGKNFIRDQGPEVIKSINFINIAAKQIRNIFIFLNRQICEVSLFLLDFILQVTQIPVKQNQQALMNLTFFQDVCALQNTFTKSEISIRGFDGHQDKIEEIFFKTIQIILSNFQGNDINTFKAIDTKLEPKFLITILTKKLVEMKLVNKQDAIAYIDALTTYEFSQDMMKVLNIIIIFVKLKQKLGEKSRIYRMYENEKSKQNTHNKELFEYLEKCLIQIEILNQKVEQTVIFPRYPVFNSLTGGLRDAVMNNVSRSSHREKIVSLLGYTSAIKSKIESSYTLLKQQKISESQMNDAFNVSALMSVVLCVYMMMFYNVIINYGQADFQASRVTSLIRFAMSLVQLSMTLVYAFYWLKFKNWQHPERKARGEERAPVGETSDDIVQNKFVTSIKNYIILVTKKLKLDQIIFFFQYTLQGGQTTQPLYFSAEFWRVALYVAVAFVGAFFYPPLYFIHIMDIFCYNPEIGNIFRAIGLNVTQLLYVSFMGVVFTFVFCTVTFSNYQKNVYSGSQSQDELCQGMLDCILQLFVSGAIAQTMEKFEIVRFVYDTIYGIFFGILFSNIISGIMLDAFTSLRDLTNELQHDKENYCYICNIDRETIEKKRKNFKEHINGKHFLWNYVFFIYFLDKKQPNDYSGLEYQITQQYNKTDEEMVIEWVPMAVQQAFDCKAKLQQMKTEVDQKVSFLQTKTSEINDVVKNFKELVA